MFHVSAKAHVHEAPHHLIDFFTLELVLLGDSKLYPKAAKQILIIIKWSNKTSNNHDR